MRTVYEERIAQAIEIQGKPFPPGETHCTGIHARAAKGIWPKKTAECWAAEASVTPRMAKYWLAGEPVSPAGKLALIRLLG